MSLETGRLLWGHPVTHGTAGHLDSRLSAQCLPELFARETWSFLEGRTGNESGQKRVEIQ